MPVQLSSGHSAAPARALVQPMESALSAEQSWSLILAALQLAMHAQLCSEHRLG